MTCYISVEYRGKLTGRHLHASCTHTLRLRGDLLSDNLIKGYVNMLSVTGTVCVIDCPWN